MELRPISVATDQINAKDVLPYISSDGNVTHGDRPVFPLPSKGLHAPNQRCSGVGPLRERLPACSAETAGAGVPGTSCRPPPGRAGLRLLPPAAGVQAVRLARRSCPPAPLLTPAA